MKIGTPTMESAPPSADGVDYFVNVFGLPGDGIFYHCPCCGFPTLEMRGGFAVCDVCYWEDDGQDTHDADRVRGGPNSDLSLSKARANFAATGTCDATSVTRVRKPTDQEMRYRKNDC
jgi:Cysteine-rich CPCC